MENRPTGITSNTNEIKCFYYDLCVLKWVMTFPWPNYVKYNNGIKLYARLLSYFGKLTM